MSNGYNRDYLDIKVGKFLDNKIVVKENNNVYGPSQKKVYISLPYLADGSNKVKQTINTCLSRLRCGKLQLVLINKYSRLENWFGYKDKSPKVMQSGVIYKLTCTCNKVYIGETARNFVKRASEHLKTSGKVSALTEIGRHLKDNPEHSINHTEPEFLGHCNFAFKRKLIESLEIQKFPNKSQLLNEANTSVKLYLFNVPFN